jgi:hypothetical protein
MSQSETLQRLIYLSRGQKWPHVNTCVGIGIRCSPQLAVPETVNGRALKPTALHSSESQRPRLAKFPHTIRGDLTER